MKGSINKILSKTIGYHLAKPNRNGLVLLLTSSWFQSFQFSTRLLDVGANVGQFAKVVRTAMPNVNIISFEPIPKDYEILKSKFASDTQFIAINKAVGNESGSVSFEVNDFSPTSSILPTTQLQKDFYPVTGAVQKIEVPIITLDDFSKENEINTNILLKIDVQGFEDKVILGTKNFLPNVAVVYVECSFKEFYEGQPLFNDTYQLMLENGFEFRGVGDQLNAGKTSEPTQVDAIFVNKKFLN
jgi:FkbM family methyltransferase